MSQVSGIGRNSSINLRHPNASSLHAAAKQRNVEEMSELLATTSYGINPNETDYDGNTPLHILLSDVCQGDNCKYRAALCTGLLVEAGAAINIANKYGEVPLFLAIKNEWEEAALVLLRMGADTTVKKDGKTLANYLMESMPDALTDVLDTAVERCQTLHEDVLLVDFRQLLQLPKQSNLNPKAEQQNDETTFLHTLLEISGNTKLYQHPVTELFMCLKYRLLRNYIYGTIALHILTLAFYTGYITFLYVVDCPYDLRRRTEACPEESEEKSLHKILNRIQTSTTPPPEICVGRCESNPIANYISIALWVIWVILVGSEVVVIKYQARGKYFTKSILVRVLFYILMPITLWWRVTSDAYYNMSNWRYPVAAGGIWVGWALFVQQLKKIPKLSVYLIMFIKVSTTVIKLALLFFPLFVGFSLGFHVMGAKNFESPYSFMSLIGMMVGAPNYEEFFDETRGDKSITYMGIAVIMFLAFVILMCVIFVNFLLGLTVSNVEELWKVSTLSAIKDQIRLMYLFDRIKFLQLNMFGLDDIRQDKFKFELHIKTPPGFIPTSLITKLMELSMRKICAPHPTCHQFQQSYLPTNLNDNRRQKTRITSTRPEPHSEIMESIRRLENQIIVMTQAFDSNKNNIVPRKIKTNYSNLYA